MAVVPVCGTPPIVNVPEVLEASVKVTEPTDALHCVLIMPLALSTSAAG